MADDQHWVGGDHYQMDDRSGFKIRAGSSRKEWNGKIVRRDSFETRQPQDFVRGQRDDQTVPKPRPRQTDVFINAAGPAMFLVAGGKCVVQRPLTFGTPPDPSNASLEVSHAGVLASSL